MKLDDEIAGILARGTLNEMREMSSGLDDICRVIKRVPFDDKDVDWIINVLDMWRKDGFVVALGMINEDYLKLDQTSKMDLIKDLLSKGLMPVSAGKPFFLELLIVKADEGKGFFGGQKLGYVCFSTTGDGIYMPVGRAATLTMAVTKLSNVLRAGLL
jgi:hypothetical protein